MLSANPPPAHSPCTARPQPYIPGYLAFREVRFLLELLAELREAAPHLYPDAILVDGNGVLHPNRFGLACHLSDL